MAQDEAVRYTVWSLCALAAAVNNNIICFPRNDTRHKVEEAPQETLPADQIDRMAPAALMIRPQTSKRNMDSIRRADFKIIDREKERGGLRPVSSSTSSGRSNTQAKSISTIATCFGNDKNSPIATEDVAYQQMFQFADVRQCGQITIEELHQWLTIQNTISLAKVKKIVQTVLLTEKSDLFHQKKKKKNKNELNNKLLGFDHFIRIITALQKSDPDKWAQNRLIVYALKNDDVDTSAEDETLQSQKPASPISNNDQQQELQTNLFQEDHQQAFAAVNCEADWGRCKITTVPPSGNGGIGDQLSPLNNTDPNRLLGIAAQVRIHHVHNESSPSHHQSFNSSSGKQRPPSSTSLQPTRRVSRRRSSTNLCLPSSFAPRLGHQESLLDCPLFIPVAGVSATENVVARADSKVIKRISRSGPPWPSEMNHMTRDHYLNSARGKKDHMPSFSNKNLSAHQNNQCSPTGRRSNSARKIYFRGDGSRGGQVHIDRQDLLSDLKHLEKRPSTAFAGAKHIPKNLDCENYKFQQQQNYEALQRHIEELEAHAIGDVRIGLASTKSVKPPPKAASKSKKGDSLNVR
uniref:EF-hand domain-containing protein n=1 Tax=Aureoumbra lagunensis TaxID=44058 RepID=A0A7S3JSS2_9STRA